MYPPRGSDPNRTGRAERVQRHPADAWPLLQRTPGAGHNPPGEPISDEKYVPWDGSYALVLQLPDHSDIRTLQLPATTQTVSVYAGASVGPGSLLFTSTGKNVSSTIPKGHASLTLVASAPFGSSIPVFITGGELSSFASDSLANQTVAVAGAVTSTIGPAAVASNFEYSAKGNLSIAGGSFAIATIPITVAQVQAGVACYLTSLATWGVGRQPLAMKLTTNLGTMIASIYGDSTLAFATPLRIPTLGLISGNLVISLGISDNVAPIGTWNMGAFLTGYLL